MFRCRRRLCVILLIGLVSPLYLSAQDVPSVERELLNSERIEQTFGSYDLDLLTSTPTLRVSNLFSTHDGRETCRTFAIAVFPARVDRAIATQHAQILAGGSIGSTFVAGGWRVVKTHRYVGEIDSTPKLESLMGIAPRRLTVHVYTLGVSDGEREIDYASMTEIHHPDYLRADGLREIYGIVGMSEADSAIEQNLVIMAEQTR
jgi:hypothetical protein